MAGTSKSPPFSVSAGRRLWAWPGADKRTARSVRAENLSGLGELAFASLWLLVFAIPWEDAITIPGLGTGARLIGLITVGIGTLAIIERGKVRPPALGHVLMALFVVLAAVSYLWSLYPEGTLIQIFTYI